MYKHKPQQEGSTWIWLGAVAVIYVLFRLHALAIPLDRDEGMFGYAGQRILAGEKLYRDVVDHKPPGVFYIYAFALRFFPPTPAGVHLFLAIYNFLTLLAVAALIRVRFRSTTASLAGGFCYAVFSASPSIQGFTASTEMLMLLPIVLSLLLAVEGNRQRSLTVIALSGAAAAAAFWIKQTAASSVAFSLLYLIVPEWIDDEPITIKTQDRVRNIVCWVAGGLLASAVIAGYFYFRGLFPELVYWSFTHNVEYASQLPLYTTLLLVLASLQQIVRGDFLVIALGVAVGLWNLKKRTSQSLFVLGFLVFSLIGTLPGFAYAHYFAQLAPAVAVAGGWGLSTLLQRGKLKLWAYAVIALIAIVPLWVNYDYFLQSTPEEFARRYFGLNPFAESSQLSSFLRARTSDQDRIFIFGSEPEILFQANRRSATPFGMIYPLTQVYPRYLEFQEQVWQDLQRTKPPYVVVVDISTSILWDGQAKLEIAEHVTNMIQTQYQLVGVLPMRPTEIPSRLVLLERDHNLPADLTLANQPNIYVYQRKGNS